MSSQDKHSQVQNLRTWCQVNLWASLLQDTDVHHDFAIFQHKLQLAISQCAEQEQAVSIPSAKLEAYGHHVVFPSAR